MSSNGIVVAGSPHTAQAGREILELGGNAVDAVVAAAFATPVSEPALASLAGGGVLQLWPQGAERPLIYDFFANGPGLSPSSQPSIGPESVPDCSLGAASEIEFFGAELSFGPARQEFFMGRGAAAVPGLLPGLMSAHERWGSLSAREVVEPACRLAREGALLDEYQAFACEFHGPMLIHSPSMRRIFAPTGSLLRAGEPCRNPALADTLEALTAGPWEAFWEGELVPLILAEFGQGCGGLITSRDLKSYRAEQREPLGLRYRGAQVFLNPPPATGGRLIALMLELLSSRSLAQLAWREREHLWALIAAMRCSLESRQVAGSPLSETALPGWRRRFDELLAENGARPLDTSSRSAGHTTHISVIDKWGSLAGMTVSYGQGNGYTIGDTGIPMNNLMGERDLHPAGFHSWPPGTRLSTNMSPTMVRTDEGRLMVLGSGGANRIRTAVLQVISNLLDFEREPVEAVSAARIHWEDGVLNGETHDRAELADALRAALPEGDELVSFEKPNMFFGGVHLALREADGRLLGCGDPRRAGAVA